MKVISKSIFFLLFYSTLFSFNPQNNPVSYTINFSKDTLLLSDSFDIEIDLEIESGFLIYGSTLLNLSPTRIELASCTILYLTLHQPLPSSV